MDKISDQTIIMGKILEVDNYGWNGHNNGGGRVRIFGWSRDGCFSGNKTHNNGNSNNENNLGGQ